MVVTSTNMLHLLGGQLLPTNLLGVNATGTGEKTAAYDVRRVFAGQVASLYLVDILVVKTGCQGNAALA